MNNALVPAAPSARERQDTRAKARANAGFLAHLIATAACMPQTRERRRAEPDAALAAYRALGQWPTETGRMLSRSL